MDGRIIHAPTPAKRVAAVCRSLIMRYAKPVPDRPDYSDLEEWLEVYLTREFLLQRIDESHEQQTQEHQQKLVSDLVHAEAKIAENKL
jgi:hypothetical protein